MLNKKSINFLWDFYNEKWKDKNINLKEWTFCEICNEKINKAQYFYLNLNNENINDLQRRKHWIFVSNSKEEKDKINPNNISIIHSFCFNVNKKKVIK